MSHNLTRGKELFLKKMAEYPRQAASIDLCIDLLVSHFESKVGVMQENRPADPGFVPSYKRLAYSIVSAAHEVGDARLERLVERTLHYYVEHNGMSEASRAFDEGGKARRLPTDAEIERHRLEMAAAQEEIDQYAVKKRAWTQRQLVTDEDGKIVFDDEGNPCYEDVEITNETTVYETDDEGHLVEKTILLDEMDLMDEFDDEDLTVEGLRAAGLVDGAHDTLSVDELVIVGKRERLALGAVRQLEDGSLEITCPHTGSTAVYQISANVFASFETDQPFRVDLGLGDVLGD